MLVYQRVGFSLVMSSSQPPATHPATLHEVFAGILLFGMTNISASLVGASAKKTQGMDAKRGELTMELNRIDSDHFSKRPRNPKISQTLVRNMWVCLKMLGIFPMK